MIYFWLLRKAEKDASQGLIGMWWNLWAAWTLALAAWKHIKRGNIVQAERQFGSIKERTESAWYSVIYQ